MLGGLNIRRNSVPGLNGVANASFTLAGGPCQAFAIDPSLLAGTRVRFGGALIGSASVVFRLLLGGTLGVADGTVLYTSPSNLAPRTPLIIDAGVLPLGSSVTRLKLVYTATGTWSINDFFLDIFPVPPAAAALPVRPKVLSQSIDLGLGTDIDVLSDLPPSFVLASGFRNLGNAIARRLDTPPGALEEIGETGDDADYGYDLRSKLNADMTTSELQAVQGEIERQCLKDERVQAAAVTSVFAFAGYSLALDIALLTSAGPYRLVLGVGTLSVDVIDAGLLPAQ